MLYEPLVNNHRARIQNEEYLLPNFTWSVHACAGDFVFLHDSNNPRIHVFKRQHTRRMALIGLMVYHFTRINSPTQMSVWKNYLYLVSSADLLVFDITRVYNLDKFEVVNLENPVRIFNLLGTFLHLHFNYIVLGRSKLSHSSLILLLDSFSNFADGHKTINIIKIIDDKMHENMLEKQNVTSFLKSVHVVYNHFSDTEDLVILMTTQTIIFYKFNLHYLDEFHLFINLPLQVEISSFENYSITENIYRFYYVSICDKFVFFEAELKDRVITYNNKVFDNMPMEMKGHTILSMTKVLHFFVFLILDNSKTHVMVCILSFQNDLRFHSITFFETASNQLDYFVFETNMKNFFWVSSHVKHPFFRFKVREFANLNLLYDQSSPPEFNVFVTAKNFFYMSKVLIFEGICSKGFSVFDLLNGILFSLQENWLIWVLTGLLLVSVLFQLYGVGALRFLRKVFGCKTKPDQHYYRV